MRMRFLQYLNRNPTTATDILGCSLKVRSERTEAHACGKRAGSTRPMLCAEYYEFALDPFLLVPTEPCGSTGIAYTQQSRSRMRFSISLLEN